jgi:hypothetical protein
MRETGAAPEAGGSVADAPTRGARKRSSNMAARIRWRRLLGVFQLRLPEP